MNLTKLENNLTVYQERLLDTAAIVRAGTTPFSMANWVCGTARCAVGDYCAARPDADLRLTFACDCWVPYLEVEEAYHYGSEAVARYFGLEMHQTFALFGSDLPSDRAAVADRIERFALTGRLP
jgi:hypothetical protein